MMLLEHDLADLGERFAAQFIDSTIASLVITLSIFLSIFSETIGEIVPLLGVLLAVLYILCGDGLSGGQSYGKKVMNICVIDAKSGKPCTFIKSFIRNGTLAILGIIDWIFIFSNKRQRLGDLLANTIVIRKTNRSRAS